MLTRARIVRLIGAEVLEEKGGAIVVEDTGAVGPLPHTLCDARTKDTQRQIEYSVCYCFWLHVFSISSCIELLLR